MKRRSLLFKSSAKKKQKEDVVLQITSMADIFTILLVFQNFSTDNSQITPHSSIVLPEAQNLEPFANTLTLEISENSILLDEKLILGLKQYDFDLSDIEGNGTSRTLTQSFIQQRRKEGLQEDSKLMILADKNTPFLTLRRVLGSATSSGFVDFKLAVVQV